MLLSSNRHSSCPPRLTSPPQLTSPLPDSVSSLHLLPSKVSRCQCQDCITTVDSILASPSCVVVVLSPVWVCCAPRVCDSDARCRTAVSSCQPRSGSAAAADSTSALSLFWCRLHPLRSVDASTFQPDRISSLPTVRPRPHSPHQPACPTCSECPLPRSAQSPLSSPRSLIVSLSQYAATHLASVHSPVSTFSPPTSRPRLSCCTGPASSLSALFALLIRATHSAINGG